MNVQRRRRLAPAALTVGAVLRLVAVSGSGIGSAATKAAPVNTGEPTISGTPAVGATLTATTGSWSNNPTSFAYQWLRCPPSGGSPDGSDCAAIGGATTQAYVVTSADVGSRLRVRVTASNASGSTTVASDASDVVAAVSQAPVNAAQPAIAGTPRVGSVVAATPGIWRNDPTAFAYQWRRCPASGGKPDASDCAVIGGATSNVYTPVAADVGS